MVTVLLGYLTDCSIRVSVRVSIGVSHSPVSHHCLTNEPILPKCMKYTIIFSYVALTSCLQLSICVYQYIKVFTFKPS